MTLFLRTLRRRGQRGQAMILVALAFVGLTAFVGLAVDAGILFSQIGHLRRAVDSASLGAVKHFRDGVTATEFQSVVRDLLALNNIDPASVVLLDVGVCANVTPAWISLDDQDLCPGGVHNPTAFNRKLVKVEVEFAVDLAFLPIIGISTVNIRSEAISEAASIDMALVIDASSSMAADGTSPAGCDATDPNCQPFYDVAQAALGFMTEVYFPYDRVSVLYFDVSGHDPWEPGVYPAGTWFTEDQTLAENAINALNVYVQPPCPNLNTMGAGGCLSTNTQEGLGKAAQAFSTDGRQEALWVVVLLSDGGANQARADLDGDSFVAIDEWVCPNPSGTGGNPSWIQPYCRRGDWDLGSRQSLGDQWYDVNDATMDMADILGCVATNNPDYRAGHYCFDNGITNGFESVIFTIGMGDKVLNENCAAYYTANPPCDADMPEELLRYIAAAGDDGNPATDPCTAGGFGNGVKCGNYFYAPAPSDLPAIFNQIASNIYTRITQ